MSKFENVIIESYEILSKAILYVVLAQTLRIG